MKRALLIAALTFFPLACKRGPPAAARPDGGHRLSAAEKLVAMANAEQSEQPDVDARIANLTQIVEHQPDDDQVLVQLAQALIDKAWSSGNPNYDQPSLEASERALRFAPSRADAMALRVRALVGQGRFDVAQAAARALSALHPESTEDWSLLGQAYLDHGDDAAAMDAFRHVTGAHLGTAELRRLARLRWLEGKPAEAQALARRAVEAAPARDLNAVARAQVALGEIAWGSGKILDAEQTFRAALAVLPDAMSAARGLARVLLAEGKPNEAIDLLAKPVQQHSVPALAWALGDAYAAAGRAAEAAGAYAQVEHMDALTDLGVVSLSLNARNDRPAVALALAQKALARRADVYTEDALAFALLRAGRIDEAKQAMARALRLGTIDPLLLFHAGMIEAASGDKAAAKRDLGRALAINPGFDWSGAREAKAALEKL